MAAPGTGLSSKCMLNTLPAEMLDAVIEQLFANPFTPPIGLYKTSKQFYRQLKPRIYRNISFTGKPDQEYLFVRTLSEEPALTHFVRHLKVVKRQAHYVIDKTFDLLEYASLGLPSRLWDKFLFMSGDLEQQQFVLECILYLLPNIDSLTLYMQHGLVGYYMSDAWKPTWQDQQPLLSLKHLYLYQDTTTTCQNKFLDEDELLARDYWGRMGQFSVMLAHATLSTLHIHYTSWNFTCSENASYLAHLRSLHICIDGGIDNFHACRLFKQLKQLEHLLVADSPRIRSRPQLGPTLQFADMVSALASVQESLVSFQSHISGGGELVDMSNFKALRA